MTHVFISYVRENQITVDRLCTELKARGLKVWLDREQILPGLRWQQAIRQAISEGAFFVACFSAEYENRRRSYMSEELTLAIDELRKRPVDRTWFIPVRLNECAISERNIGGGETLSDIQRVDLFPDWNAGVMRILKSIGDNPGESQLLKDYSVTYSLVRQGAAGTATAYRKIEFTPVNLTALPCPCRPSVSYELYEKPKFKTLTLRVFHADNDQWRLIHEETGQLAEDPEKRLTFRSSREFELPPGSAVFGSDLRVEFSEELMMNEIDRDIVVSYRPLRNVTVTCDSERDQFEFSVGDSPKLQESVEGRQWTLVELQPREVLVVRWKPISA